VTVAALRELLDEIDGQLPLEEQDADQ